MLTECTNDVDVGTRKDGTPIIYPCGKWRGGEKVFCDDCLARYEALYPQGWTGYPGDTCKHGRYTGGSGADYMCGACEFGE